MVCRVCGSVHHGIQEYNLHARSHLQHAHAHRCGRGDVRRGRGSTVGGSPAGAEEEGRRRARRRVPAPERAEGKGQGRGARQPRIQGSHAFARHRTRAGSALVRDAVDLPHRRGLVPGQGRARSRQVLHGDGRGSARPKGGGRGPGVAWTAVPHCVLHDDEGTQESGADRDQARELADPPLHGQGATGPRLEEDGGQGQAAVRAGHEPVQLRRVRAAGRGAGGPAGDAARR
ncbi:unnamed protein product, partial [Prorocentrum cordatum]